ncbi:MAG TPA: ADP-forming succinate--CoA ligase subunit beta [Solirubrobacteraceae bacterium]|nr:ADP-forming succinate--CoA ligase subunit beta [Solirubrobacteraceae bacterium]
MDLLEYQGKQLLARHGIPMQAGKALTTVDDALATAEECGYPVVVKAQVRVGGRGKAGGIKLARDADELAAHAGAILGMQITGCTVRELWVGQAVGIAEEYYASVVFDRRAKSPLMMLSRHGGVEIETVAEEDPDALATLHVDPLLGYQPFHGRRLAFAAGIPDDLVAPVGDFLAKLYATFVGEEASLVEVNPLVVTPGAAGVPGERELVALDAKVTLDDNALFRHPENAALRDTADDDPQERMARARGLTYVKLDGDIGILGNGAGLVMSTLDLVALHGGAPANFLDAGGGSKAEAIKAAVEVILSNERVKAVLFNIFGGITRCDEVARGLIAAFAALEPGVPFVVRLDGTNGAEGRALLAASALAGLYTAETMDEAAALVVALARGESGLPGTASDG